MKVAPHFSHSGLDGADGFAGDVGRESVTARLINEPVFLFDGCVIVNVLRAA
jgi:hypothetical protein